jgi:hypothetical protein
MMLISPNRREYIRTYYEARDYQITTSVINKKNETTHLP